MPFFNYLTIFKNRRIWVNNNKMDIHHLLYVEVDMNSMKMYSMHLNSMHLYYMHLYSMHLYSMQLSSICILSIYLYFALYL